MRNQRPTISAARTSYVFVLRVWLARSRNIASWRAVLEEPQTGRRHAFADLSSLVAFLDQHAATAAAAEPEEIVDEPS